MRGTLRSKGPLLVFLLLILAVFGYPLFMLVYGAFRTGQPGTPGTFGPQGFVDAYGDPATWETLWASVFFGVSVNLIGIVFGFVFAWLAARTTMPGRRLITPVMVTAFAIPSLFFAISWGMLTGPTGMLTQILGTGPDGAARFDALSWTGLILVAALKAIAVMYLLMLGPVRALNRSQEEAALLSGASKVRLFIDVNIPLLIPTLTGLAILGFVNSLGQLDIALILGVPAGIYVFPTQIYDFLNSTPIRYDSASVLGLMLIVIVYLLVGLRAKIVGKKNYVTVTGKNYRIQPEDIGPWGWVGLVVFAGYAFTALVLPLVQLLISSFQPVMGVTGFTTRHYERLLDTRSVLTALQNTFVVGIVAGFLATALAVLISYVALRSTSRLARLPELIVWAVVAVPGIVLALAITWAVLAVPGLNQLYGTLAIVLIALVIVVTPIAQRATSGPVGQLGKELEEAARIAGAGPVKMLTTVVVPLIGPSFIASWFITGIMAAGSLDIPILLSTARTQTVSLLVYNYYAQLGDGSRAAALLIVLLVSLALMAVLVALVGKVLKARQQRTTRKRAEVIEDYLETHEVEPEGGPLAGTDAHDPGPALPTSAIRITETR